ncbi:recombinase family protein [Thermosynechococcus sp. HN-54]|uniref:recombinase family protein n=1 Tax=Thermosynechococcus sp. HN-54 TaxID=2933959 RepID=UPI00202CC9AD|nr:recombinase family protein [Thermosynechococcus sp. HN-54]URR35614.1 recombinase family protein [Thermosynechococcus sp. HN-54]
MVILAYEYIDPLWQPLPDPQAWGQEIDYWLLDVEASRPHLRYWLQRLEPGYWLLQQLSALGRTVTEVSDRLRHLEVAGITVIALAEGYVSDRPPTGDQLLSLWEQVKQQLHQQTLCHGHARNRLKHRPPPGRAPYGYRRGKEHYVIDRAAAAVVKDFVEHFLLYGSLSAAVRFIANTHHKRISIATGRRWLTHPVYRGHLYYQGHTVIPQTHPPLIAPEEAAQVDRLLRRQRSLPRRSASAPHPLAGLVVCRECQQRFGRTQVQPYRQPSQYAYLRPLHCPLSPKCRSIPYNAALTAVIDQIAQRLPRAIAQLSVPTPPLTAEIQAIEAQLHHLGELETQGLLDTETAQLRRYKLAGERAQLEAQRLQLPPSNLLQLAVTLGQPQFWYQLSAAEQRFYLREFLHAIEVTSRPPQPWSIHLRFIWESPIGSVS